MIQATIDGVDKGVTFLTVIPLPDKSFKSGKQGYWGQGKYHTSDGKQYQIQVQIVQLQK